MISIMKKLIIMLSILFLGSCAEGGGTTTGNPATVTLNFSSYNAVAWSPINILINDAHAGVNNLSFCFKRLRFKTDDTDSSDPTSDNDNIDFDLGEKIIDTSGTFLGSVSVPEGTYKRVEFDLEDHCSSTHSVELNNDNGSFNTGDRITIKFSGNLTVQHGDSVNLDIQVFIDSLKNFNGTSNDLRDTLRNITGAL